MNIISNCNNCGKPLPQSYTKTVCDSCLTPRSLITSESRKGSELTILEPVKPLYSINNEVGRGLINTGIDKYVSPTIPLAPQLPKPLEIFTRNEPQKESKLSKKSLMMIGMIGVGVFLPIMCYYLYKKRISNEK